MLGQRVVENFFRRAKFRRSKRIRVSIRSSSHLRREAKTSALVEDNKPGKCGIEAVERKGFPYKLSDMSATASGGRGGGEEGGADDVRSTTANSIDAVSSSTKIKTNSCSETGSIWNSDPDPCCTGSLVTPLPNSLNQQSVIQSVHYLSSQSLIQQHPDGQHLPDQSSCSVPSLGRPPTTSDSKVIEALQTEVDRLRKELSVSQEVIGKMQEREKQLRNRLSEQAQRQLQKGPSKFEDLSLGEGRPTQLIKRYGNIYTESRLDAMDALDDVPNMVDCGDLKNKLLLSVIVLAFRTAEQSLRETKSKVRELLHIPRVTDSGNSSLCHAAKELEESIAFYLRKTVNRHDISKTYKEVCERVWTTLFDYPLLKECQGLLRYINDCVRTAWALTVQNPPFVIDYESSVFNPDMHARFHTSDPGSPEIRSVLWPVLLESVGGPCVSKGIVLT